MSYTSQDDARDHIRATVEADARTGTGDYVEARGMLQPATEYYARAVRAVQASNRQDGPLLSQVSMISDNHIQYANHAQAAEAFMSLGQVSLSSASERLFGQALEYLRTASQIPGYTLPASSQRYDNF